MDKLFNLTLLLILATNSYGQMIPGSFMHDGLNRSYSIYIPANYNAANAHPIVFDLHGYTSNGAQQAAMTNMDAIADTAGFILIYPEGTVDGSSNQYWNSGYGTGVDDIGFMSALIDTVAAHYNVNLQRVYSTGLSNGGIMSNTLACELNDRIAAIAGVGGTMSWLQRNSCSPANKIPVMHIHGTSDAVVPYAGNSLLIGVDNLVSFWRTHNSISTNSTTTAFPNVNAFDGSTADLIKYETGSTYPVHLIRVNNGGHSWPGSGVIVSGSTNMDFSASLEIWKFFNQHEKVTPTSKIANQEMAEIRLLGANPVRQELSWESELEGAYELTLYNIMGQVLLDQTKTNARTGQLNVENLPQGTYVAVFRSAEKIYTLKFVKESI